MGWSGYQDVVPPTLSKSVRGTVVHAYDSSRYYVGLHLVDICYVHRYFRMSAGWVLLEASVTAPLHRLTEALLGKRHIQSPSRRHYYLSPYSYDVEIAKRSKNSSKFLDF